MTSLPMHYSSSSNWHCCSICMTSLPMHYSPSSNWDHCSICMTSLPMHYWSSPMYYWAPCDCDGHSICITIHVLLSTMWLWWLQSLYYYPCRLPTTRWFVIYYTFCFFCWCLINRSLNTYYIDHNNMIWIWIISFLLLLVVIPMDVAHIYTYEWKHFISLSLSWCDMYMYTTNGNIALKD